MKPDEIELQESDCMAVLSEWNKASVAMTKTPDNGGDILNAMLFKLFKMGMSAGYNRAIGESIINTIKDD